MLHFHLLVSFSLMCWPLRPPLSILRPSLLTSGCTGLSIPWGLNSPRAPTSFTRWFTKQLPYCCVFASLALEGNIYYRASLLWFSPPQAAKKSFFLRLLNWCSFHTWYTDFFQLVSSHFHQATGDPYYLEAGRTILDNLNRFARVPCGFAGMKDVRTGSHEDR